VPNWYYITVTINKRLRKNYTSNYVQNVHNGVFKSKRLKREIKRLLYE